MTLEYELTKQLELHDMLVSIPIPPEVSHTISNAEVGQATYSRREGALQWSVPLVDSSNASATIEFSVSGAPSADAIFPISISFSSRKTLCEMAVDEVLSAEDNCVSWARTEARTPRLHAHGHAHGDGVSVQRPHARHPSRPTAQLPFSLTTMLTVESYTIS